VTDQQKEGVWKFVGGQKATYWKYMGQINNYDGSYKGKSANCGAWSTTTNEVYDYFCGKPSPFICELKNMTTE